MTTATIELTKEEIVQRGLEIYERDIRALLEASDANRAVAIDVLSGEYVIDADLLISAHKLRERFPEAIIFFKGRYPRKIYSPLRRKILPALSSVR